MKYYSLCIAFLFNSYLMVGQANNPFAQRGEDLLKSIDQITKDYNSNIIKELNSVTIEYYSKKAGLKTSMSVETTAGIIKALKSKRTGISTAIQQSSFSVSAQQFIKEIISNPTNLSNEAFRAFLINKNTDIESSSISKDEKEAVLTLSAVVYLIKDPIKAADINAFKNKNEGGCFIQTPEGTTPIPDDQCILTGVVLGFVFGWNACGFWCAIGGGIIGGVVAAVSIS